MVKIFGKLACGVAATALFSTGALAQDEASTEAASDAQSVPSEADASFDEAFPQMVTGEVVQGGLDAPGPLVQQWDLDAVTDLIGVIENIAAEGLDPRDYDLQALKVSMRSGLSEELSDIASKNFVWLVEDLRDGRTPMDARKQWFVVDPDRDNFRTGDLLTQAMASGDVSGTLASLNPSHKDYARLKQELADTPATETKKRKLIRANMDRWRWLARDLGTKYLITNVPEYQLRVTVGDKIIKSYRTIVGKPGRTATPQLAEEVSGVVFNPTWTVPQSIVKGEGLGQRVLNNPAWAKAKGYKATKGANGWISVVQQPGPTNSLGRMKLEMPNPHAIFFHDTPSRGLFKNANRALSHGCIRTENALEVAMMVAILGKGASKEEAVEIATSGKYTKVMLEKDKKIPAYITYFTLATNIDGEMEQFKDIYGRDAPVLASLDKPREGNRSNVIDDEVIVIEDDPRVGG
ncbi:L,D-transpeptidase family protein [Erythrobacter crassostreae]|uniref:L,D-transpeptidase family protein n=1 Tax=Erythrobacter crassostreae TaxID=2828328 RepID=A0A9X1F0N7_9SPHN|nr:L,D-transpeptidase family protein [Erythrobacter crassostrea]MBV7258177.1 L,D-transpeptidase family protein [Erythrobacter crassostrea]